MDTLITSAGLVTQLTNVDDPALCEPAKAHAEALNTLIETVGAAFKRIDASQELTGKGKNAEAARARELAQQEFDRIERSLASTQKDVERERARLQKSIDSCLEEPGLQADASEAQRHAHLEKKLTTATRASWILGQLAGLDSTMLELKLRESVALGDRETLRAVLSAPPTFRILSDEQAKSLRRAFFERDRPETGARLAALEAFTITTLINRNTAAKRLGLVPSVQAVVDGQ